MFNPRKGRIALIANARPSRKDLHHPYADQKPYHITYCHWLEVRR
jgi:hypothetical protein